MPDATPVNRLDPSHADGSPATGAAIEFAEASVETSTPFVGEWRTLVSTTNWEKGRIIAEWRASLESAGAAATEYSDEAWAQLVGGVTSQHVGRLRRVHNRFGGAAAEYDGLYWSHFQAATEWQDAEMWLEGALQNGWSVSQMRGKRWETVGGGAPAEEDPDQAAANQAMVATPNGADDDDAGDYDDEPAAEVRGEEVSVEAGDSTGEPAPWEEGDETVAAEHRETTPEEKPAPSRPFADLAELPDDLADAFEQFKLAILTHKLTKWADVSRDDVLGALESLKQLALAPTEE